MRLNHDCIRDIMLYVEDNTSTTKPRVSTKDIYKSLDSYAQDTIDYYIYQLDDAGMFVRIIHSDSSILFVWHLSWIGHEYLNNIRDKSAWKKLKESGLSSMSLEVTKDLVKI